MKVFLISNMYPNSKHKSYGIFVKNFKQSLEQNGITINNCALIKGKTNNTVAKLFKYIIFYIEIIFKGIFKSYDIIYVHFPSHSFLPIYFINLLRNKKLVLNFHGNDIGKKTKFFSIYYKLVDNCSLIVAPTKTFVYKVASFFGNKSFIKKSYDYPSGGYDSTVFYPNTKNENRIIQFGFISRLDKEKGAYLFIEALNMLKKNKIKFNALIAGEGDDKENILDLITKYQLADTIKVLPNLTQTEMSKYFREIDAFIFPTNKETESLGLVGIEALACGTPVIASNIDVITEYIKNDENGYTFEKGNSTDLFNKMLQFTLLSQSKKLVMQENAVKSSLSFERNLIAKNLIKKLKNL